MVDPQVIDSSIERFGESIILVSKSAPVYTDYGEVSSQTTSQSQITAVVNEYSGDEEFNKEGRYRPGDKVFFCKSDTEELEVGNEITIQSETYEIKEVVRHRLQGQNFVREVRTNKIG